MVHPAATARPGDIALVTADRAEVMPIVHACTVDTRFRQVDRQGRLAAVTVGATTADTRSVTVPVVVVRPAAAVAVTESAPSAEHWVQFTKASIIFTHESMLVTRHGITPVTRHRQAAAAADRPVAAAADRPAFHIVPATSHRLTTAAPLFLQAAVAGRQVDHQAVTLRIRHLSTAVPVRTDRHRFLTVKRSLMIA